MQYLLGKRPILRYDLRTCGNTLSIHRSSPMPPRLPIMPNDSFFGPFAWIAGWRKRRCETAAQVEQDAVELVEKHGVQAYGVARWRAHQIDHGKVIDDSRSGGHWRAVSRRVAKLVGHEVGLDNATRRETS